MGYFPEELPPPFHTKSLARWRKTILATWAAINQEYPKTIPEVYSVPRFGRARRNLSIVNPIAQVHLGHLIAENWIEIKKHFRKSISAIEQTDILDKALRAVPPPDRSLLSLKRTEISATYNHALRSDVSRFYGTLYTHAIPWALHTKAWCKANLNTALYNATLGARLDKAVRKGQDNQTLGIPIGPDTSRIISEIIGVALDQNIQRGLDLNNRRAFRYVDDWYIGFDTNGEAEQAIAVLASACRDYELELNPEKTIILSPTSSIEQAWPTRLQSHPFFGQPDNQLKQLDHYFALTFQFANEHPKDNVISYAVQRTRTVRVERRNWYAYENFLLRSARLNRTVLPAVVGILISYNADQFPLDLVRIEKLIKDVVLAEAIPGHHDEVAWCLFLAKALRIRAPRTVLDSVARLESSVCALLALDLERRELTEGELDKGLWLQSMTPEGLRSNMWLLAYEADLKGWLRGPENFALNDAYFGSLRRNGVSFYDPDRNITHIRNSTT